MLRLIRSSAFQRQASRRGIVTSRTLLMALSPQLTSLNNAASCAQLDLDGSLEEMAAKRFSEASAFPEFSPTEDILLGQAVPHIQPSKPVMDAHTLAAEELMAEMQKHFCEPSDFPEYTPVEEEAILLKEM
ncbi:uncharacterized protein PHALS_04818 [Plasmopara halstedii]|uniref:Uncharacterized protein n=1 Tax=Plasmopara halstedii TaxID=4781 RepID=A0A0P1B0H2_PLAHL|nr:uncharacterized protein PHALS_04818 [Plasmopara halstedii]CEG47671.1 hypothetical protein PHALS_04818 [Plasmopara halstedii]|eukprot:XP_024584040.1 hypothetical protein PHALS_04818 [Plasmopara halstedii]